MYRSAFEVLQNRSFAFQRLSAAFFVDKQVGVVFGRGRMQPMQFAFDANFKSRQNERYPVSVGAQ